MVVLEISNTPIGFRFLSWLVFTMPYSVLCPHHTGVSVNLPKDWGELFIDQYFQVEKIVKGDLHSQ